VANKLQHIAA